MKNYKLLIVAGCLWASSLLAQITATNYVTAGLADLTAQNWVAANTNFNLAVNLSPSYGDANALLAATRLLTLPETPAGSNFLVALGFPKTNLWVPFAPEGGLPQDINGNPVFPPNYNSATAIAFFRTNVMAAIDASLTNLSRITDPGYTLSLTHDETHVEAVTVDYGDIQMLQALLWSAKFFGYTLNENNCSFVLPQVASWIETNGFTLQLALATYPNLLTMQNTGDLALSKTALTNAIAFYFAASDFIRNQRANGNPLFNFDTNNPADVMKEAEFRTDLTNALLSLNTPVELNPENIFSTINAGAWFSGTNSLRKFIPQFNGNSYVINTLPDYTFGGILPYQPAYMTEAMLRNGFPSYAGVYYGVVNDLTFSDSFAGSFAVFIGTNKQVNIVGYDYDSYQFFNNQQAGGVSAQFTLGPGGNWEFNSTNVLGVAGYGWAGKDGSFGGDLAFTNGDYVELDNGYQQSAMGPFQNAAGLYTGNWSGGGQNGTLQAVLSANGGIVFCVFHNGAQNDGGEGQFDINNYFTATYTASGSTVTGSLNPATFTISGNFTNNADSVKGTFSLSRSAKVLFDTPPVITTPLPPLAIGQLGTNVTLSLIATGSAPMCYQWYSNNVIIPNAITNRLVIAGLQYASAGTYSVTIINLAGETNAAITLSVVPEAIPPTIQITAPTPGLQVSNADYTITGKAGDNVLVSNVWFKLNTDDWELASTTNQWTNWWADVTLIPGTNVVSAYAVDTSGNVSVTNTVSNFVYIVSAPLTVTTNGLGTLNPNYNGVPLQIGKPYSITATAGSGFAFTSWSGGTNLPLSFLTNGATIQFTMVSNLMLRANFTDVTKPTLSITNVTAGMTVSNAAFTVKGIAGDNVAVSNVFYSLNNTGWSNAVTGNNWSNWMAAVTLLPGTNMIAAYAVDTTGNLSLTNTLNMVYVVSATLTVSTNGVGSLSPNYSGASLQIGQSYAITATAGTGFAFTNWMGGTNLPLTLLTNGSTVRFVMVTNLMLQATFADITKPTLSITNVTAGMTVSNAAFTVKGTAGDNVAVSNVFYSLNNTGWSNAVTGNNWSNWMAAVTLLPGTNTIAAYAVDTTGNLSLTNTLNMVYVVSATLTVSTNGVGSLSPNYSGASLQIGQSYAITATAGTGFAFTNWMGGTNLPLTLLTNGSTVRFVMATNLILQANFADVTKPTLSITNLAAGQRVSNAVFTVKGTAADNWQVGNVLCQVNGGEWNSATNMNNWTNWAAGVALVPGTNAVQAYAVDTTGNLSVTSSVSFQYVVTNQLGVRSIGLGTINPNDSNAWLEVGRNYSIAASPASGFIVTNWTISTNWLGGVKTNNATVQFMMASNLTLLVTFADVTKPTLTISSPTAGQRMTNALANVTGTASDNWQVAGVWCQLNSNGWLLVTTTNIYTNWSQTLTLVAGTNTIKAYAVDLGGNYSATNTLSVISSNTFQLQLKFTAALPLTSTGLNFSLLVSSNLNGHIQVSSNLVSWLTLTNFVGTNSTLNFRDPTATNSGRRFYRAVIP